MEYEVRVLVQGYATVKFNADSDEEAKEKALSFEHGDFELDVENMDYDSSPKYRELHTIEGKEIII